MSLIYIEYYNHTPCSFLVRYTLLHKTLQIGVLHARCDSLLIVYLLVNWKEWGANSD